MSYFPKPADLAGYDPVTQPRDRDALDYQLAKHDFQTPDVISTGLNISVEIAEWLLLSSGATYLTVMERLAFTPAETFPASVAKAVVSFRRLLSWCESNAKTEYSPAADVNVAAGVCDSHMAQWLYKSIQGESVYSGASLPNVRSRQQSLDTIGCSPATIATAIAAPVEDVQRWLGTSDPTDLPFNTVGSSPFGDFLRVLRFLASGPTYLGTTRPRSKAAREGVSF